MVNRGPQEITLSLYTLYYPFMRALVSIRRATEEKLPARGASKWALQAYSLARRACI